MVWMGVETARPSLLKVREAAPTKWLNEDKIEQNEHMYKNRSIPPKAG
jgi:hypothetical protein